MVKLGSTLRGVRRIAFLSLSLRFHCPVTTSWITIKATASSLGQDGCHAYTGWTNEQAAITDKSGELIRSEGDNAIQDKNGDEVYGFFQNILDFYFQSLKRDSIDDQGFNLIGQYPLR